MSAQARLQYERYIQSTHWAARKRSFFSRHPRKCRGCGSTDDIQLHHGTYERMGCELDSDLFPVCQICHNFIHELHKIKRGKVDLMQATVIVLAEMQRVRAEPSAPQRPSQAGRSNPLDKTLAHIRQRRSGRLKSQGFGRPIK